MSCTGIVTISITAQAKAPFQLCVSSHSPRELCLTAWPFPVQPSCLSEASSEILLCPHSAVGRGGHPLAGQDLGYVCTYVTHPSERALELSLLELLSPFTVDWVRLSTCWQSSNHSTHCLSLEMAKGEGGSQKINME